MPHTDATSQNSVLVDSRPTFFAKPADANWLGDLFAATAFHRCAADESRVGLSQVWTRGA
jgi:hypothetical protein